MPDDHPCACFNGLRAVLAVAYGVIAGLSSYVALHLPFWIYDIIFKRWRGPAPNSPRSERRTRRWGQRPPCRSPSAAACTCSASSAHYHRRLKAGYNHVKMFGPIESRSTAGARSGRMLSGHWTKGRAQLHPSLRCCKPDLPAVLLPAGDSMHGYDDSYHSVDSRRSALPPASQFGAGQNGFAGLTRNTSHTSLNVSCQRVATLAAPAASLAARGRTLVESTSQPNCCFRVPLCRVLTSAAAGLAPPRPAACSAPAGRRRE